MTEKDIRFQLDLLWREGYHAAAKIIETLQNTISREVELKYLKNFIQQRYLGDDIGRYQLRCLWTTYCFHHNLDADTSEYDSALQELWDQMTDQERENEDWEDVEGFEGFMCCYLV